MALPTISNKKNPFEKRKPVTDSSGNLIGYDTGTQSVRATESEKLMYKITRRRNGGGSKVSSEDTNKDVQKQETTTDVNRDVLRVGRGGVTYGRGEYIGNAVVPDTGGKTANQLRQEAFLMAREKYGNVKRDSYVATYDLTDTKEKVTTREIPAKTINANVENVKTTKGIGTLILPKEIQERTNEFKYKLPHSGNELTFKLLTHGDEKKIEKELEGLKKFNWVKWIN